MALKHLHMVAVAAIASLSSAPAWAYDNAALEVQHQGDIAYVSGGVGKDESEALQATQHNYNLRIMNADKLGHFSGNTRVVISDAEHNALLDTTSGPIFYANLPKGKYLVEAYSREETKKQSVAIANGKTARIRFVWSDDVSDTPYN